MRHFISLGIRGLFMEFGAILMRALGSYSYHRRLRSSQSR